MVDIIKLLGEAKELGASDVHITVGVPPKMRIQGQLKSMDFDRMLPDETEKLLTSIMTEEQKAYLDKNGEVDFSFAIPVLGSSAADPSDDPTRDFNIVTAYYYGLPSVTADHLCHPFDDLQQ